MLQHVDARFFRLDRNAKIFIDEMNSYGYWCQLTPAHEGVIVNVFMEVN